MFLITCLGEPNTSLLLWETGPERSRVLIDTARECSHVAFEGVFFFGKSVREQKKKKNDCVHRKKTCDFDFGILNFYCYGGIPETMTRCLIVWSTNQKVVVSTPRGSTRRSFCPSMPVPFTSSFNYGNCFCNLIGMKYVARLRSESLTMSSL